MMSYALLSVKSLNAANDTGDNGSSVETTVLAFFAIFFADICRTESMVHTSRLGSMHFFSMSITDLLNLINDAPSQDP
jgi:hypothetical protein